MQNVSASFSWILTCYIIQCYKALLENRCIQIFLFPTYHSRMEQNWYENKKIRSFLSFKNSLLKIGQLTAKPTYNIYNPNDMKFLTRLRLALSHHFFLHCHHLTNMHATLLDDLQSVDINIPSFADNELVDLLLYGSPNFNFN